MIVLSWIVGVCGALRSTRVINESAEPVHWVTLKIRPQNSIWVLGLRTPTLQVEKARHKGCVHAVTEESQRLAGPV
jgi:hypothetical protein